MGQGRALPSAHFSLSTHSSVHPCCHSEMTEWLGPSNKHIYIPVGCGVQIMLEMGECRQKMDFSPGNCPKALSVQIPLCYYLEIQPALGADKERTDISPWGILFWVCTRDWREAPVLPYGSEGRYQQVALVCSSGPCKGVLLFAVSLCLAAHTLGLPKTASSWATEVCTPFHRKV